MRALFLGGVFLLIVAEAAAQSIIIPQPVSDFPGRMNRCVAAWNITPVGKRGTMSYRQFTSKCMEGKKEPPIQTLAACRNGATAPATAPEGACAYDGGIDRWLD